MSAPGLPDGDVRERAPGGVDAARGRVAQVDQVGQPGGPVLHDRPRDLDHLHERRRALLHPGAAARGGRQQGQPLGGRAAYGAGDPAGRGQPDRPGQEPELVGDHRYRPAVHQAAAGQHRLVGAGLLARRLQLGAVARWRVGDVDRLVPGLEGALVEDQVEELLGGPAVHHVPGVCHPGQASVCSSMTSRITGVRCSTSSARACGVCTTRIQELPELLGPAGAVELQVDHHLGVVLDAPGDPVAGDAAVAAGAVELVEVRLPVVVVADGVLYVKSGHGTTFRRREPCRHPMF